VVDWKTGRRAPDPVQLAVYRLTWADHAGVPVAEVAAGFYHVAEDRLELVTDAVDPEGLPGLVAGVGWPRADLG
jgi:DNA helicase-2/ATP-dependent DNA helicase PcrA